jgi:LuxR family maltose regulon positive regulatory protein
MTVPLLATKLYIPPLRPNLVPRPRLIERLNEGLRLDRRLTLVSAPAGFGKTTLISEWFADLRLHPHRGQPIEKQMAWLSLDQEDNEPARFWTYFVGALRTVEEGMGESPQQMLPAPQALSAQLVLTGLLNDIAALPYRIILVLDDFHLVSGETILEGLAFLLDHQPQQLHLVLATRADPPLPISRLRARGQLTELHSNELRFTPHEIATYLNEMMELALAAEHVAALEQRTEGWIAGLQLAALSLQGHQNAGSFIQAFTGSQRYVLDYLTEEVLNRQSAEIQTFLLQTAVLDRLTGSLCDAVAQGTESQRVLESLEAANLFIVPLDEERRWYRYHRLFADLLRRRLGREQRQLVPDLHLRASKWYEEEGLFPDAVSHLLAAGDSERAAGLIDWTGWAMLARGEMRVLLGWLDALPHDLVDSQPQLSVLRAWALALTGQWDGVEWTLGQADEGHVPGEVKALHAYLASVRGDVPRTMELCRQALEDLPEEKWFSRSIIALSLGIAHFASGKPAAASQALSEAIALGRAAGPTYMILAAMMTLGHVQEMGGSLRQAVQTFHGALELSATQGVRPLPLTGMAYVGLAQVQYEWDDLDGALRHALDGIELTESGGFTSYRLAGYARLFEVYQARGEVLAASHALEKAERLAQRRDYAYMTGALANLRIRWWVAQGNLAAASQWIRDYDLGQGDAVNLAREAEHLAVVRVLLALDQPAEALASLAQLQAAAETDERMGSLIEILALRALAFRSQGDADQALSTLERALSLAEPEGYVRTFVDEGEPMAGLLRRALVQGMTPGYASRLLAAFGESAQPASPGALALVEPLTGREVQVLRLVAAGLSNQEIAQELVVAVSTVKSHINHIYGKLDVKNRTQATARAQTLGLL